ncbi:MAG: hypothetical protein FWG71_03730 [Synergistaceae bacterium]|nr:hypothetical protein [Synergistaceae bacterium]
MNKHGRQDAAPTPGFEEKIEMKELPKRKPNRLKDYDYSQNGAYFVTICALGRMEIFSAITVGAASCRPRLTRTGEIIENEILTLSRTYEGVSVDCSVIMPNHVHMIIGIYGNGRQDKVNSGEAGRYADDPRGRSGVGRLVSSPEGPLGGAAPTVMVENISMRA